MWENCHDYDPAIADEWEAKVRRRQLLLAPLYLLLPGDLKSADLGSDDFWRAWAEFAATMNVFVEKAKESNGNLLDLETFRRAQRLVIKTGLCDCHKETK